MTDAQGALDEARYLMGNAEPAVSSILVSSSPYLNNPRFRDVYAQMGLKRDGHDLPSAYLIPEVQRAFDEVTPAGLLDELLEEARGRLPEFADWLDRRFVSRFAAKDLARHAPGTLGAELRRFITESGMEVDFMFRAEARSDLEYLNKRRVQVHDIEHMVTGFDPSPVGEIALIVANIEANDRYFGSGLAAELNRFGTFLVSTSLMRAGLHYPNILHAYFEGIALGRSLGRRQTRPLFMIQWEEFLDWSLTDIRSHFGFDEAPAPDHWAWTYKNASG
ncbi:Coq4 family protein [Sphingobium sp. WCS2017Hpa-17]|uniref:Coq4 family protein n=1 Tax=Sphingobium sp. WCS2017Hpa-17 TaxID=3073638 RepID=UPI00288C129F|nr:Coq4 family protein [Sphingobium sp. WCS2017Hpa-17]